MTDYGVIPSGFNRKPLAVILAEIEARMVTQFGPDVIQTSQSPFGQINGLMADVIAQLWEITESTYQSFDPSQAEGNRLDVLATWRLLKRVPGEADDDFRKIITNIGRARIDLSDLQSALRGMDGVTYARAFVNDEAVTDVDGIPPQHVAAVVIGGDNDEIAATVRRYVVPGVGTYGNTIVQVNLDGFCRRIKLARPAEISVRLKITVIGRPDRNSCPPPSALSIAAGLYTDLTGPDRPENGRDGDEYLFRQRLEALYPNVEVTDVRMSVSPAVPVATSLAINFFQIMKFDLDDIEIIST